MRRTCFRKAQVPLAHAVALMLLALPVAAAPAVGPASPGSSIVAKVFDAFAGLWRAVSPEVVASPTLAAWAKDGEDDGNGDRVDALPIDSLGCTTSPDG